MQQEILYLLFGVCYISAGGHFGKWPPRPPGGSSVVAPPPDFFHYILFYLCAKIGAFIKKCTIGLLTRPTNRKTP